VPDAPEYAVDVFSRALAVHGVTVAGPQKPHGVAAPVAATVLWTHESEPMDQMLADLWWPSDNLMAELFLKELSVANGADRGNDADGAKAERVWLRSIGVDPATLSISDGSGLSNYDRVTPRALLLILQHDWNSADRQVVLDALPVAGVVGTLKDSYKGTPAEYNVWAKTGSISHVRTISGFLRTRRHGAVTFSFMVNNWMDEDSPGGPGRLATLRGNVLSRIITE
jgi:D-alanyl-D-alanine carboxypeptidase/D-alanyl-D-alanine-endopeptidase (penicillin-binding protein 4)